MHSLKSKHLNIPTNATINNNNDNNNWHQSGSSIPTPHSAWSRIQPSKTHETVTTTSQSRTKTSFHREPVYALRSALRHALVACVWEVYKPHSLAIVVLWVGAQYDGHLILRWAACAVENFLVAVVHELWNGDYECHFCCSYVWLICIALWVLS